MNDIDLIENFIRSHNYDSLNPVAALIDMDGTLYDSMGNHADAWIRMVSEIGIKATRDEFFLYEGRTGASTINILFNRAYGRDATQQEIEELYHRKTVYFRQMPDVRPMPGARRLVDFMIAAGLKRVLVTGSGQSSLIDRLDTDFPGAFSPGLRVTSRDVVHGKPHPEPYIRAMQLAGVTPSMSVAFENAPLGVKSAADAGVFTIAVVTGPVPREDLADAGAAIVYDSMEQCAEKFPALLHDMIMTSV